MRRMQRAVRWRTWLQLGAVFWLSCCADDAQQPVPRCDVAAPCSCADGTPGSTRCSEDVAVGCTCQTVDAGTQDALDGASTALDAAPVGDAQPDGAEPDAAVASGPKDGDPAAPELAIDGVPCRAAGSTSGGFGLGATNLNIGGRDLVLDYPCGKHEGAQLTFILNLHGTMTTENLKLYQRGYFSAHRFVSSHNLIIATPKTVSPMGQWGNQDNGQDEPHLLAVIAWVYEKFAKANVRSMWVGGHSWGGMYSAGLGTFRKGFVCHDAITDKVKGVVAMSGGSLPVCAERVSLITTRGGNENIMLVDQSAAAMKHGCTLPLVGPEPVGNNQHRYFAGCTGGFAHEDYVMTGKGHTDAMDVEVVQKIVESIKAAEQ